MSNRVVTGSFIARRSCCSRDFARDVTLHARVNWTARVQGDSDKQVAIIVRLEIAGVDSYDVASIKAGEPHFETRIPAAGESAVLVDLLNEFYRIDSRWARMLARTAMEQAHEQLDAVQAGEQSEQETETESFTEDLVECGAVCAP